MDTREALRKLQARKREMRVGSSQAENPLFKLLKGIVALVAPLVIVYYGSLYFGRTSADEFARQFLQVVSESKYAEAYNGLTADDFRGQESLETFSARGVWLTQTLGKLQHAYLKKLEVPVIGGMAEIEYDGAYASKRAAIVFVLAREKLNRWKVLRYKVTPDKT